MVDVAGGNGQFLARLLAARPRLSGTVFDLRQQVERGQKVRRRASVCVCVSRERAGAGEGSLGIGQG